MTEPLSVEAAAALLRAGKLVAFATETVYGLGAHALNAEAVAHIFETKGRPRFDPLIVHVADVAAAQRLTQPWPEAARALAETFWPGPLTLVLPKVDEVPDLVTAGLPTVGIRCPAHPTAQALLHAAEIAIAAPSANRFTQISPTTAEHVRQSFPQLPVLDGGPCSVGVESTIVSFARPQPALLRPGGLAAEDIERIVGPLERPGPHERKEESPGRHVRHYAPKTPLVLRVPKTLPPRVGHLSFQTPPSAAGYSVVEVLTERGELKEAASRLFAALRRLEREELDLIVAELVPDEGLGRAINDRLRRAAQRADALP